MRQLFMGIDVGSVSTNLALLGEDGEVLETVYLRTGGRPIAMVQEGLTRLRASAGQARLAGVATTGSARYLIGTMLGADLIKNEITAHAVATLHAYPEVKTIMEIGGQDSKIIIVRDGIVIDFAMNTVCAAGTGSFLDQQAGRLNIGIEEFSNLAVSSANPVAIAGRCAVFAESDMIHKQQIGHAVSDIAAGLCEALVRNYLNNVGKGKEILPPIAFQGGVAANMGMRKAFEKTLGLELLIPEHYAVMGAVGAALLARDEARASGKPSGFAGWQMCEEEITTSGNACGQCSNNCELVALKRGGRIYAYFGDRCGRWTNKSSTAHGEAG